MILEPDGPERTAPHDSKSGAPSTLSEYEGSKHVNKPLNDKFVPRPNYTLPRLQIFEERLGEVDEQLRNARDALDNARFRLEKQGNDLRESRRNVAITEQDVSDLIRNFLEQGDIAPPESLSAALGDANFLRDKLGVQEYEYEETEYKYNSLEYEYTRFEEQFMELLWETKPSTNSGQDHPTKISDKVQVTTYEIPGLLSEAYTVSALGDTAAKYNFIKEDYAVQLGIPIERGRPETVTIRNGHKVTTTGKLQADFNFQGEAEAHSLTFHLLPDCIHDVILGKAFLKATKTFKVLQNFKNRVRKRIVEGVSSLRLLYLGESAPKFTGLLNGRPREALADSGAGALIMDEDYARSMGIPIQTGEKYRHTVRFADNTTARTSGMSCGVRWEFGLGGVDKEHLLDFHILKNAPANVILSDELLFGTNAFEEYDCYLVDEDDEDDDADAYFHGIRIDESYTPQGKSAVEPMFSLSDRREGAVPEELSEDIRRAEEEDRIEDLPLAKQPEAREREKQRQIAWDVQHQTGQGTLDPVVATGIGTHVGDADVQATGGSAAPATTQDPVSPQQDTTKRSRWRFKLKHRKET